MDLFPETLPPEKESKPVQADVPLALRLTPKNLGLFFGQEHLLSPGKLLRRAIEFDRLGSVIFFGPSGTGKSALARLIASKPQSHFVVLNAVTAGVAELRKEIESAKMRRENRNKKTILLVDEIHHEGATYQGRDISLLEQDSKTRTMEFAGCEHAWDLVSKEDQGIASGLYLFTVKDEDSGDIQSGKFQQHQSF